MEKSLPCPTAWPSLFHPHARGPGEPVFSRPCTCCLRFNPSQLAGLVGLRILESVSQCLGRGGAGTSWLWGLEPGSGTKGEAK